MRNQRQLQNAEQSYAVAGVLNRMEKRNLLM